MINKNVNTISKNILKNNAIYNSPGANTAGWDINIYYHEFVQLKTIDIRLTEPYYERNNIVDELNQVIKEKKKGVCKKNL